MAKIVAAGMLGVVLGLLFTIYSLNPEARGIVAGPWRGSPRDGTLEIDPYALAAVDRSGVLPLGAAEGLLFVAATDSAGDMLSPTCDYDVLGPVPAARFWTLGALTRDGFPIANPAERYAFTSAEILRADQEPVAIAVSREARAGNWLPIGQNAPYLLALHLYDTGLSAAGTTFDAGAMPAIRKRACRS